MFWIQVSAAAKLLGSLFEANHAICGYMRATKIFVTTYCATTKEVTRLWWRYLPSAQCLLCCGPVREVRDLPRMKQSCEKCNECSLPGFTVRWSIWGEKQSYWCVKLPLGMTWSNTSARIRVRDDIPTSKDVCSWIQSVSECLCHSRASLVSLSRCLSRFMVLKKNQAFSWVSCILVSTSLFPGQH